MAAEATTPLEAGTVVDRNVALIEKAVANGTTRPAMRALRLSTQLRKRVTAKELKRVVEKKVSPTASAAIETLLAELAAASQQEETEKMDTEEDEAKAAAKEETTAAAEGDEMEDEDATPPTPPPEQVLPEIEVYLLYLGAGLLCREKRFEAAARLTTASLARVKEEFQGRRTLEPLGAKIRFYDCLAHEKLGLFDAIRPRLLAAHRTACVQRDEFSQAVLLNAIVRGLLEADCVDAAFKIISKTSFPEHVSNNQFCRYLYYTGRVAAIQLDYTDAYAKLAQSTRKAPANTGLGFRRAVHQLAVLVQLLMGELPLRSAFRGPGGLTESLEPYLRLTVAVRRGSLHDFNAVLKANAARFTRDNTYTLALRLAPNVVKTGLRQINISYSRISLEDVTAKLQLDSTRSTEFIISKAIKDGVIDAVLDHENGHMCSKDVADVYATDEPQKAFHRRVAFCLDVHNEALKAMIYPPQKKTAADAALPSAGGDEKTDEERAKEIEDELDDDGL